MALTPAVKQEVQAAADREERSTAVPTLFQDKLLLFKMVEGMVDQRGCVQVLWGNTHTV